METKVSGGTENCLICHLLLLLVMQYKSAMQVKLHNRFISMANKKTSRN